MTGAAATTTPKKKPTRAETKAGLTFPVGRIRKHLKGGRGGVGRRVNMEAAVYIAAVLEHAAGSALHAAATRAKASTRYTNKTTGVWKVMLPHLQLAAADDRELASVLGVSHLVHTQ
jgi:histone H2A